MKKAVSLLILVVLFSGCRPVTVQTAKMDNYSKKLDKVLLIHKEKGPKFLGSAIPLLITELGKNNVTAYLYSHDKSALNYSDKVSNAAQKNNAKYILSFDVGLVSERTVVSLKAKIIDFSSGKEVWKAYIVDGNSAFKSDQARLVEAVIESLRKDSFL